MSTKEMPQPCVAKAIPEHDDNTKGRSHLKRIVPHTPLFSVLDRDGIKEYLAKRPIRNQVGADQQQQSDSQMRSEDETEAPLFVVVSPSSSLSSILKETIKELLPQAVEWACLQLLMQQQDKGQALRENLWSLVDSTFGSKAPTVSSQSENAMTAGLQDQVLANADATDHKRKFNVTTAAQLREQLLKSARWLTAQEIATNAGFTTLNPSSQPNKWKKAGLIFAVFDEGRDLFPAYALGEDGRPLPVMKEVLAVFAGKRQPLSIAAWFAAANSWLKGKTPMEMLAEHGEDVVWAARMEISSIEHG